ncbi:MAG: sulfatase-like hydrolase/transferase [Chloroflexota bacterium]
MSASTNLLVFMVDQWRYDAAGHTGNPILRTPHLDRLAAEGARLTRAFTTVPLCTPTRASLWTGLWPTHHGVLINTHWRYPAGGPQNSRLPDGVPTLGTILRDAGYATAYFGKWHVGTDADLPRAGFDHALPPGAYERDLAERGVRREVRDVIRRDYIVRGYPFAGITSLDGGDFREVWLCDRAEAWLRRHVAGPGRGAGPPFGCVVSLPGPHPGYVVPERYAALYDPKDVPLWPNVHDDLADKPAPHRLYRDVITHSGTLGDDEWRVCIARYYAFCTLIDEQLGRMLALLEELGVAQNTLVLFVSDHGDLIGAHGLWDKGPFLYEEQLRVPCIARLPGALPAGAACAAFVSLHDLLPTVVEGLGLELPRPVDGRSVWPQLRGEPQPADWPDDAYVQYHGEGISLYSIRALRTERYKYVYYPFDRDELYDLQEDPWELRNLIDEPSLQPVLAELRARLVRRMEQADDVLCQWTNGLRPLRPTG